MDKLTENLKKIRHYDGHPGKFWPAYLEHLTRLANAGTGLLLAQGKEGGRWKKLGAWPPGDNILTRHDGLVPLIKPLVDACAASRCAWKSTTFTSKEGRRLVVLGIRLEGAETTRTHVALLFLDDMSAEAVEALAARLALVSDVPATYQRGREVRQVREDLSNFSGAMDLMVLLNAEKRYVAASLILVNELASRYGCSRASLGWLEKGYVRLQSISHMERFEKKTDIVQALEAAMEEALDQDEEILWPPHRNSRAVSRDHDIFSKNQGSPFMVSIPLRLDNAPVGVLTCERADEPFREKEVHSLRVVCDQAARRLGDLKARDRWVGARLALALRDKASRLMGVEHTFAKGMGLLVSIALLGILFGQLPYRVESPFILRSDNVRHLPAPFKGYIDDVRVSVGDAVETGTVLLTLDTRELLLEESAAIANQVRYFREAEKARAENALAEMKIALALADQAKAQLELVRYHLSQAEVRAPLGGFVVEGDFEELLGAPVQKGDVLFKVSRLDNIYAELEVSERDIHELSVGASGEIAFVSQPQLTFPIVVARIDPVAIAKKNEGNVFLVRCTLSGGRADWWRPGMSGVAKITIEKRNLLWILTHKTLDFFRMRLWW